ncbi:serine-rich adhesin for platelets-like [Palaemon carinicauda]|uniref:serine-rich adhesin for platelets-like n=1 Tax=Palaemon carinicauda TaxID=392227 RepID=UPI0035B598B8
MFYADMRRFYLEIMGRDDQARRNSNAGRFVTVLFMLMAVAFATVASEDEKQDSILLKISDELNRIEIALARLMELFGIYATTTPVTTIPEHPKETMTTSTERNSQSTDIPELIDPLAVTTEEGEVTEFVSPDSTWPPSSDPEVTTLATEETHPSTTVKASTSTARKVHGETTIESNESDESSEEAGTSTDLSVTTEYVDVTTSEDVDISLRDGDVYATSSMVPDTSKAYRTDSSTTDTPDYYTTRYIVPSTSDSYTTDGGGLDMYDTTESTVADSSETSVTSAYTTESIVIETSDVYTTGLSVLDTSDTHTTESVSPDTSDTTGYIVSEMSDMFTTDTIAPSTTEIYATETMLPGTSDTTEFTFSDMSTIASIVPRSYDISTTEAIFPDTSDTTEFIFYDMPDTSTTRSIVPRSYDIYTTEAIFPETSDRPTTESIVPGTSDLYTAETTVSDMSRTTELMVPGPSDLYTEETTDPNTFHTTESIVPGTSDTFTTETILPYTYDTHTTIVDLDTSDTPGSIVTDTPDTYTVESLVTDTSDVYTTGFPVSEDGGISVTEILLEETSTPVYPYAVRFPEFPKKKPVFPTVMIEAEVEFLDLTVPSVTTAESDVELLEDVEPYKMREGDAGKVPRNFFNMKYESDEKDKYESELTESDEKEGGDTFQTSEKSVSLVTLGNVESELQLSNSEKNDSDIESRNSSVDYGFTESPEMYNDSEAERILGIVRRSSLEIFESYENDSVQASDGSAEAGNGSVETGHEKLEDNYSPFANYDNEPKGEGVSGNQSDIYENNEGFRGDQFYDNDGDLNENEPMEKDTNNAKVDDDRDENRNISADYDYGIGNSEVEAATYDEGSYSEENVTEEESFGRMDLIEGMVNANTSNLDSGFEDTDQHLQSEDYIEMEENNESGFSETEDKESVELPEKEGKISKQSKRKKNKRKKSQRRRNNKLRKSHAMNNSNSEQFEKKERASSNLQEKVEENKSGGLQLKEDKKSEVPREDSQENVTQNSTELLEREERVSGDSLDVDDGDFQDFQEEDGNSSRGEKRRQSSVSREEGEDHTSASQKREEETSETSEDEKSRELRGSKMKESIISVEEEETTGNIRSNVSELSPKEDDDQGDDSENEAESEKVLKKMKNRKKPMHRNKRSIRENDDICITGVYLDGKDICESLQNIIKATNKVTLQVFSGNASEAQLRALRENAEELDKIIAEIEKDPDIVKNFNLSLITPKVKDLEMLIKLTNLKTSVVEEVSQAGLPILVIAIGVVGGVIALSFCICCIYVCCKLASICRAKRRLNLEGAIVQTGGGKISSLGRDNPSFEYGETVLGEPFSVLSQDPRVCSIPRARSTMESFETNGRTFSYDSHSLPRDKRPPRKSAYDSGFSGDRKSFSDYGSFLRYYENGTAGGRRDLEGKGRSVKSSADLQDERNDPYSLERSGENIHRITTGKLLRIDN